MLLKPYWSHLLIKKSVTYVFLSVGRWEFIIYSEKPIHFNEQHTRGIPPRWYNLTSGIFSLSNKNWKGRIKSKLCFSRWYHKLIWSKWSRFNKNKLIFPCYQLSWTLWDIQPLPCDKLLLAATIMIIINDWHNSSNIWQHFQKSAIPRKEKENMV